MKTKNWPLSIGILLPLIFMTLVAAALYLPTLKIKPQYNFIFMREDPNYYNSDFRNTYKITDGKIGLAAIQRDSKYYEPRYEAPELYLYDFKKENARQITLDEAQQYVLYPNAISPDGYSIEIDRNSDGLLFDVLGSRSDMLNAVVTNGKVSKKINVRPGSDSWNFNLTVIGWVK